jgi:hypothetical protein
VRAHPVEVRLEDPRPHHTKLEDQQSGGRSGSHDHVWRLAFSEVCL